MSTMGRKPKVDWLRVRREWEAGGISLAALARKYGVSPVTVSNHKRKEMWVLHTAEPAVTVGTTSSAATTAELPDPPTADFNTVTLEDLETAKAEAIRHKQRVQELERALAEAEAEKTRLSPERDIHIPVHVDELAAFLGGGDERKGREKLHEIAVERLAEVNKQRIARGFLPYDFERDRHKIDDELERIKAELLDRRTRFAGESNLRVVKMWLPNGNIVQVPWEWQISNEAGQQGTALWKMREKGAKLVMPYLCQRSNCWLIAQVSGSGAGRFVYHGYCSELHMLEDPYLGQKVTPGVIATTKSSAAGSALELPPMPEVAAVSSG